MAIRKAQQQIDRDITQEVFPERVKYEPQFALELLWGIGNRLKRGQPLKPEDVVYLIDAFDKINNGLQFTGPKKTKPANIGKIVARALYLSRPARRPTNSFLSKADVYFRVKNLRGSMTLDGACMKVAAQETAKGRPIKWRGIKGVYQKHAKVLGRIKEVGERIHKQTFK